MVHASMSDPDRPELVVSLPADVDAFAARRPRLGDLTPEQREAIATLAADGDQLTALAEAVGPLLAQLSETIDGLVASLRAAGLDVDGPELVGLGLPCRVCGDEGHHVSGHDPDPHPGDAYTQAAAALDANIEGLRSEASIVVVRSDEFEPPLTPAQTVRAQQAINDALVRDRSLRPEAVLRTDGDGRLVNLQGRPVLVDSEGLPILVAGLPVVAPGS